MTAGTNLDKERVGETYVALVACHNDPVKR